MKIQVCLIMEEKGIGPRLQKGMTLAIEPMVVEGSPEILDNDKDRMDSCNFRW